MSRRVAKALSAKVRVVMEPKTAELGSRLAESPIPCRAKRSQRQMTTTRKKPRELTLETARLLLREGFDVVSVTADYQCQGLHPAASRPAGWFASVACARADFPRRRECPSHPNGVRFALAMHARDLSPDKRNWRGLTPLYSQVSRTVTNVSNSSMDELVKVPSVKRRTLAK